MYDEILLPTDGSDPALRGARQAMALAAAFDARLHVLSAVDVATAAGPFDAGGVDESTRERLESDARSAIDSTVELTPEGVRTETAVVDGSPAEAILDYVADHEVDLVTMGTHGRGGLRRYVLGSVTESVVRRCDAPVVTVRGERDPGEYDTVLVPTDGSGPARAAVDHAIAVAEAFDASIHALGVVDLSTVGAQQDVAPASAIFDQLTENAEEATAAVAERAEAAGVDVETVVEDGFPASEILDYVENEGIDFLAMGTHGRSGLDRFLLGSTTERVIRHADPPVLTVRESSED